MTLVINERVRRRISFICVLLLVVNLLTGGSIAYFTDYDRTYSQAFIDMDLDISLLEPQWLQQDQGLDSLPGDCIPADPVIVNHIDPVYMRIRITLTDTGTGERITGARADKIWSMVRYTGVDFDAGEGLTGPLTESEMMQYPPYNQEEVIGFERDEDRSLPEEGVWYFNYNSVLQTDQSARLYDYVVVPSDWTQEDMQELGEFRFNIVGEAIHHSANLIWEEAIGILDQAMRISSY